MYACSLETERGLLEGVCAPVDHLRISSDPPNRGIGELTPGACLGCLLGHGLCRIGDRASENTSPHCHVQTFL